MPFGYRKRKYSRKSYGGYRRRTGGTGGIGRGYSFLLSRSGKAGRLGYGRRARVVSISDTEFVTNGDIPGTQNFALFKNNAINPTNVSLFPWLAQIAQHFQKFRFKKCQFIYTPTSGMAVGGNNQLGSVCTAISYNALTRDPLTKVELLSYDGSVTGSPAVSQSISLNCKRGTTVLPWLYVQSAGAMIPNTAAGAPNNPGSQAYDNRFSCHGIFYLGTSGQQAGVGIIGELRVRYTVLLSVPCLPRLNNIGAPVDPFPGDPGQPGIPRYLLSFSVTYCF